MRGWPVPVSEFMHALMSAWPWVVYVGFFVWGVVAGVGLCLWAKGDLRGDVPSFDPDLASHPGETLKDWVEENPEAGAAVVKALEEEGFAVQQILSPTPEASDYAISPRLAWRLERLGVSTSSFWLRREAFYRAKLAQLDMRGVK